MLTCRDLKKLKPLKMRLFGALASANSSSAERGKIIVDSVIPELVRICQKEFK